MFHMKRCQKTANLCEKLHQRNFFDAVSPARKRVWGLFLFLHKNNRTEGRFITGVFERADQFILQDLLDPTAEGADRADRLRHLFVPFRSFHGDERPLLLDERDAQL